MSPSPAQMWSPASREFILSLWSRANKLIGDQYVVMNPNGYLFVMYKGWKGPYYGWIMEGDSYIDRWINADMILTPEWECLGSIYADHVWW